MLLSKNILTFVILAATLFATGSTQAQRTRFNPDPEGTGPGIEQPAQSFFDHQLGVRFTRVNIGGGESRPSVRFNPGGEVGTVSKGLRIDFVDCNGLGKRIGLERGDVIVRCDTAFGYDPNTGGGAPSSQLRLIDIRTGRMVNVVIPGIRLNLNINGSIGGPGFGPGPEIDPIVDPGSRPSFTQRRR